MFAALWTTDTFTCVHVIDYLPYWVMSRSGCMFMTRLAYPDVPGMVVNLHVRSCGSSLLFNIHKFIHNKPLDDLKETITICAQKLHFEEKSQNRCFKPKNDRFLIPNSEPNESKSMNRKLKLKECFNMSVVFRNTLCQHLLCHDAMIYKMWLNLVMDGMWVVLFLKKNFFTFHCDL